MTWILSLNYLCLRICSTNLQSQDTFCTHILTQIRKGNIKEGHVYVVQNNILKRYVNDGNNTFETVVLPRALTAQVLKMAHDDIIMEHIEHICYLNDYITGKD